MWPRHAGDFAFLRAYVDADGNTAEHSEANVPYKHPHWLEVDFTGAQEGEFVMVAGYPGRTFRYRIPSQLRFVQDVAYPFEIGMMDKLQAILKEESQKSPLAAARLSAPIFGLANSRKYKQGMLDNFQSSNVVERHQLEWDELQTWINKRSGR